MLTACFIIGISDALATIQIEIFCPLVVDRNDSVYISVQRLCNIR
jgi:hypothetical protein